MKRTAVIAVLMIVLCLPLASAYDESELEYEGCEYRGTELWCLQPAVVFGIIATMTDDVWCYSSEENLTCAGAECADHLDVGCFSMLETYDNIDILAEWAVFSDADSTVEDIRMEYETKTILAGEHGAVINPWEVDFIECELISEESVVICPYNNTKLFFDGNAMIIEDFDTVFLVVDIISEEEIFDLGGFFSENILYIGLIIVLIIVAFFVLKPKKNPFDQPVRKTRAPKRRKSRKTP